MEQKVVLNVSYERKSPCLIFSKRTKPSQALKIAAAPDGVQSVGWKEGDKSKLEVNGEGIDVVSLTKKLIKQIGHTTIASVELKEEKKEDKKEDKKEEKKEEKQEVPYQLYTPVAYIIQEIPDSYPCCSIIFGDG